MISYRIDKTRKLNYVKASGLINVMDMMLHMEKLHHDPDFAPWFNTFVNLSNETFFDISTSKDFVNSLLANLALTRNNLKVAIYCPDGVIKAFMTYHLSNIESDHFKISLFTDEHRALEWLSEQ